MFKNYFVTAIHNLQKNKLYSFINIIGLAIGLAACMAIFIYVDGELSYDEHWQDADRIYRVNDEREFPNEPLYRGRYTANPVLSALKGYYPTAIEAGTRIEVSNVDVVVADMGFQELIARVDADFNRIFQLDVIAGSLEQTLSAIDQLALSEDVAEKLFGTTEDAIGKLVSMPGKNLMPSRDYKVTAVYRAPEDNTVLFVPMLTLIDDNLRATAPQLNNWAFTLGAVTYVKLDPSADINAVESRLPDFIDRNANFSFNDTFVESTSAYFRLSLQPIGDIHLNPWSEVDQRSAGSLTSVLIFIAIAALVLIIACVNFILMTTAKSTQREREVAIRKVMGAKRASLVCQFLGESLVITGVSAFLSVVLLEFLLPFFSTFIGKELSLNYQSLLSYAIFIAATVGVGVLCGWYPAAVMSSGKPSKTLNTSRYNDAGASLNARNLLVVFQFSVSIALVIATAFVYLQGRFASSANLGFDPQNLLVIENLDLRAIDKNQRLKTEIDKIPGVVSSSLSFSRPAQSLDGPNTSQLVSVIDSSNADATDNGGKISLAVNAVDTDFFATYDIALLAGRAFDNSFSGDLIPRSSFGNGQDVLEGNVLINRAAVRQLGFSSPKEIIGQTLRGTYALANGSHLIDFSVIGVVANASFHKPRGEIEPEIFFYDPTQIFNLTIRYDGNLPDVFKSITATWASTMGTPAIRIRAMDTILRSQYQDINAQTSMLGGFSVLAILLACLGLLGTSVFFIERRTKEIGIRKVMGAKVRQVVRLLLWQFSRPVIFANLIAYPVAVWVMLRWLEGFHNQINSLWLLPLCVVAGLLSLISMWLVVVSSTLRIAKQSPIYALRYE